MSEIVTSLLKAVAGFLVDKARDRAAEKLKEGDVTDNKIRELIQREMDDIKSKLDALSRKDLLTAIDAFQVGVRYVHQALETGSETVRSANSTKETLMNATEAPALTGAIERGIKSVGITEFGAEAKDLLLEVKKQPKLSTMRLWTRFTALLLLGTELWQHCWSQLQRVLQPQQIYRVCLVRMLYKVQHQNVNKV